jgi:SOS-response transcriptional repressor LexA
MSVQGLTPKAGELLAYLRERTTTPSYEEMGRALGLKSQVARLVDQLEGRGFVERIPGRRRSLKVVVDKPDLSTVATESLVAELCRRGWFSKKQATA